MRYSRKHWIIAIFLWFYYDSSISSWLIHSKRYHGDYSSHMLSSRVGTFLFLSKPSSSVDESSESEHLKLTKTLDKDPITPVDPNSTKIEVFEAFNNSDNVAITLGEDKYLSAFYKYLYQSTFQHTHKWTADLNSEKDVEKLTALWKSGKVLSSSSIFPYDRRLSMRSFADNVRGSVLRMKGLLRDLNNEHEVVSFLQSQNISGSSMESYRYNQNRSFNESLSLMKALANWFRGNFPYFHDKCDYCGNSGSNLCAGITAPSEDERIYQARSVEVFVCSKCSQLTRFPRYNDVEIVLRTKKGRCGEYSALIVRILKSLRYKARWVADIADHLWAEVLLGDRWVHFDPCEAAIDEPLIYQGWGKNQTYIVAYDCQTLDATDVTEHYTTDIIGMLARRASDNVSETTIVSLLNEASRNLTLTKV